MVQQRLNEAKKALLMEHRVDDALLLLHALFDERGELPPDITASVAQMLGWAYTQKADYDQAAQSFMEIQDYYQAGYSMMLKGDLAQTFELWKFLFTTRTNHWALSLLGMVTVRLNAFPTFLQIRNHLEADIHHLIRAGQTQMAHNIVYYVDILGEINYEAYKFVGRGLLNADCTEQAGPFLQKGQQVLPNDPEIYYHLGQYYAALGQYDEAQVVLKQCLMMSPVYVPAKDMLARISA